MTEEKKIILTMLKEGKISQEEALRLLDAVEEPKSDQDFEDTAKNFLNKFMNGLNSALKKTGDALAGIDVNDFGVDIGQNRAKTENIIKTQIQGPSPRVHVRNTNGRVHLYTWDNDYIETRTSVSFDKRELDQDYDFITIEESEGTYTINSNQTKLSNRFTVSLSIALPRICFNEFMVESTNGSIEVNFLEAKQMTLESTNGSIECNSVSIENATLETTQGNIDINDVSASRLSANTTNGTITCKDVSIENLITQTINGLVRIGEINKEVRNIDSSTVNGNIYISIADFTRPIKASLKGKTRNELTELLENFSEVKKEGKTTLATTETYDDTRNDNMEINSSTVNGRISIS